MASEVHWIMVQENLSWQVLEPKKGIDPPPLVATVELVKARLNEGSLDHLSPCVLGSFRGGDHLEDINEP